MAQITRGCHLLGRTGAGISVRTAATPLHNVAVLPTHTNELSFTETVEIDRPPETVMAFVLAPESVLLVGQVTERCFRVPDTPVRAVGEQQVVVTTEDGLLVLCVSELVELDFPRSATTIERSVPGDIRVRYTCDPTRSGGTTYTQEVRITPQPHEVAVMQLLFEAETRRSVARIREVLENDEWTPPARP